MGRGKRLSECEIVTIKNLRKENCCIAKIAKLLSRSRKIIYNLLRNVEEYGKKKSTGRPKVTTDRQRRAILRVTSNSVATAREIAAEAGVNTNVRNVQRIIKQCKYIKRKKLMSKPPLTKRHKEARLQFAEKCIHWRKKWRRVIFSDEKRFTLDGPDGYRCYFHDLRKETHILSRRHSGGGVMVWAGIGYYGNTEIKFISGTMKSPNYITLIDEQLKKHAVTSGGPNYIFQQDNASVHTAKAVKEYFRQQNIKILEWPARSPDLNIIENCWAQLSRSVYAKGKQFQTVEELKNCIERNWISFSRKFVKKLFKSVSKRLISVIQAKGGTTKY